MDIIILNRIVKAKADEEKPHKRCSKCKKILPGTTEYFYKDKDRKDGFASQCKQCRHIYRHIYYIKKEKVQYNSD